MNIPYSFSQLSLFQTCPRKYQYKYLDKFQTTFVASYHLILGNAVHATLQRRYQQIFPGDSLFSTHISTREETQPLYQQFRDREVKKNSIPARGNPQTFFHRGEIYLQNYLNEHSDFSSLEKVETEKEIGGTSPKGQTFKGYIDRLDFYKEGTISIVDYKTGQNLPIMKDTTYREQIALYGYLLKQNGIAQGKIQAKISYLHFGLEDEYLFSEEEIQEVAQKYQTLIDTIEYRKQQYHQGKSLPLSPSSNCKYCDFRDKCPRFSQTFLQGNKQYSQTELADMFGNVTQKYTDITYQINLIKPKLISYMLQHHLTTKEIGTGTFTLSHRTSTTLTHKEEVIQKIKESGLLTEFISSTTMKHLFEEQKLSPLACEDSIEYSETIFPRATPLKDDSHPDNE